ncbi:unnamed protein product [Caenorhabditis brenneri]
MLLVGLLLVLVSTVSVESSPTKFHISGDFFCEFDFAKKEDYVLDVKVMEQDFWFFVWFDDDITIPKSLKMSRYPSNATEPNQKSIIYEIEAEDDGDGLWPDYEVYLSVQHNCNIRRVAEWKNWDVVTLSNAKEHWLRQTVIVTDLNSKKRSTDDKNDGLRIENIEIRKI